VNCNTGAILVLSGPSGAGKSTLLKEIIDDIGECYFSISTTTRPIREGEKDGIKRYTTEIIANEMQLIDGRGDGAGQQSGGYDSMQGGGGYGNAPQQSAPQQGGYGQVPAQHAPQQHATQGGFNQPQGGYGQAQQAPAHQPASAPQPQSFGSWGNQPQQATAQAAPQQRAPQQPTPKAPEQKPQPAPNFDDFDDDIPF